MVSAASQNSKEIVCSRAFGVAKEISPDRFSYPIYTQPRTDTWEIRDVHPTRCKSTSLWSTSTRNFRSLPKPIFEPAQTFFWVPPRFAFAGSLGRNSGPLGRFLTQVSGSVSDPVFWLIFQIFGSVSGPVFWVIFRTRFGAFFRSRFVPKYKFVDFLGGF